MSDFFAGKPDPDLVSMARLLSKFHSDNEAATKAIQALSVCPLVDEADAPAPPELK